MQNLWNQADHNSIHTPQDPASAPNEGGSIGVVLAALVVGGATQGHDVMAALLNEQADDALNAIAYEVAPNLCPLLLVPDELLPDDGRTG